MDDEVVQRVFEEGGRDYLQQETSTSSSSSILQSLPLHVSFDHGYYLLVKAVQELREKKEGLVTVGIGGPSGSGKTSLAEKVASVIGCTVVSMENYRDGVDDGNDLNSIDFDTLVGNLEDLMKGKDAVMPLFDFQGKKRVGSKTVKSSASAVVIIDGTYALHSKLRSLLDIRVAVAVFILVYFPKYDMIMEILVPWITSSTVSFHCSESRLNQTSTMLRIFDGYFEDAIEKFGVYGYDFEEVTKRTLRTGLARYMNETPNADIRGYLMHLEELHRLIIERLAWLRGMLVILDQ
ncbi:hypothetical protein GIB67_010928 [Kingdonia uniflora]|uniref:Phosphoribulokinase/uridine kinase domain-containing protein n=1 Tax=Kingdonia uniflora TaxID=39325 RepID=A0A7J7M507_9MAGN|nr:hypothetical protein GIB67_010928 [Kingdonia uniflora]